ncbi:MULTISPECIES: hypothetical protein [unclassified Bradyrhizobium]|uniref:hypothetical protein n=1 Tax=unclassified Bradyrhizobium TaxID=2631580 RepID=UPI003398F621
MVGITIVKESGFRILPKPRLILPKAVTLQVPAPAVHIRKINLKRPVEHASPADFNKSLDERTQLILNQIIEEAHQLDDDETRDLWLDGVDTFRESGNIEALIEMTEFRRKVVDLEEFIFGNFYLGLKRDEIFPGVLEAMLELDTDKYVEAVLKGALGYGKTTMSNIMMVRGIHKLSCMRHPQSTFGIRSGASIAFSIQSIRLATAKKAVFDELGGLIKQSPYFKYIFPYNKLITTEMIFPEHKLRVLPVSSSSTGAISMNILGGVLDEMNFMQKVLKSKSQNAGLDGSFSQAKSIYEAISRRRRSRFAKKGKLPGLLFLISSSRFPDDFTETKAAESAMQGGTDPNIFVMSKAIWDVKGRDQFLPETFRVMVGNSMVRSKILSADEPTVADCDVIEVPEDFRVDFERDLDGSLRDYAGRTILASRPFINRRSSIHDCMNDGAENGYVNPFEYEQYDFHFGIPKPKRELLKTNLKIFRTAHIDMGLTRDACGIAIGHIAGQKLIERFDPVTKLKISELKPIVGFDCILRCIPPPNGEIEFAHIREFLIMMRDQFGLPIEYVTFDGFQSVDSRQILRTKGFKADYLSVEQIDPYRSLRDSMYDRAMYLPRLQFLANELAGLEYVRSQGTKPDKVDHRSNGTKDVADAVCGVTSFLLKRRVAWSPILNKINVGSDAKPKDGEAVQEPAKSVETARHITLRKSVFRRATNRR